MAYVDMLAGPSAELLGLTAGMITFIWIAVIIGYVYGALTMMITAQRLNMMNPWMAWIPFANLILLARMAKMPTWPVWLCFGLLIPFLNILVALAIVVFVVIWTWKVLEIRKMPGWYVLLVLIPYLGGVWSLVMWGMLAWKK